MLFLVTLIYLFTKKKKKIVLLEAVNNYFQLQKKTLISKESLTLLNKK